MVNTIYFERQTKKRSHCYGKNRVRVKWSCEIESFFLKLAERKSFFELDGRSDLRVQHLRVIHLTRNVGCN